MKAKNKKNKDTKTLSQVVDEKWWTASKKYGFSRNTLKHLKTLERYYDIDLEKRIITIPFHFDQVSDLVEVDVGNEKNPIIKREWLATISEIAHNIPTEFNINIDLKINKYEGYSHKNIARSILDSFEMFHYDLNKKKAKNNLKTVFLFVAGLLIFAWLFYLCSKHWFGESGQYVHDTIHEIVYSFAAVFIWEAVYVIFLESNEYNDISGSILKRVKEIKLFDAKNHILQQITNTKMVSSWNVDTGFQKFARKAMLIASTALLCLAGCKAIDVVEIFIKYSGQPLAIASAAVTLVGVVMSILGGIGAISYYRDKGPLKKFVLPFSIIEFVINLADLIILAIRVGAGNQVAIKGLVLASVLFVLSLLFLISTIALEKNSKKQKQKLINEIM